MLDGIKAGNGAVLQVCGNTLLPQAEHPILDELRAITDTSVRIHQGMVPDEIVSHRFFAIQEVKGFQARPSCRGQLQPASFAVSGCCFRRVLNTVKAECYPPAVRHLHLRLCACLHFRPKKTTGIPVEIRRREASGPPKNCAAMDWVPDPPA